MESSVATALEKANSQSPVLSPPRVRLGAPSPASVNPFKGTVPSSDTHLALWEGRGIHQLGPQNPKGFTSGPPHSIIPDLFLHGLHLSASTPIQVRGRPNFPPFPEHGGQSCVSSSNLEIVLDLRDLGESNKHLGESYCHRNKGGGGPATRELQKRPHQAVAWAA